MPSRRPTILAVFPKIRYNFLARHPGGHKEIYGPNQALYQPYRPFHPYQTMCHGKWYTPPAPDFVPPPGIA